MRKRKVLIAIGAAVLVALATPPAFIFLYSWAWAANVEREEKACTAKGGTPVYGPNTGDVIDCDIP